MTFGAIVPPFAAGSSNGDLGVEDVLTEDQLALDMNYSWTTYHIVNTGATILQVVLISGDFAKRCR